MTHEASAYGLWSLVVINVAVFAIFAYSFARPRTACDWRSFGAFTGFLVALFVEMYGFPLSIYLLAGRLQRRYPGVDLFSHDAGHLWETLLGWNGKPHLKPLHLLSSVFIAGGFILLARAWPVLYAAQQRHELALSAVADPPHARDVPEPHLGVRASRQREEGAVRTTFGRLCDRYAALTPAFIPGLGGPRIRPASHRPDLSPSRGLPGRASIPRSANEQVRCQ